MYSKTLWICLLNFLLHLKTSLQISKENCNLKKNGTTIGKFCYFLSDSISFRNRGMITEGERVNPGYSFFNYFQTSLWHNFEPIENSSNYSTILKDGKIGETVSDDDEGCFSDSEISPTLSQKMSLKSSLITKSSCKDRCNNHNSGKGFKYSGIQFNGVENICFCGDAYRNTPSQLCTTTCSDGSNCGGNNANYVSVVSLTTWKVKEPKSFSCVYAEAGSLELVSASCDELKSYVCIDSNDNLHFKEKAVTVFEAMRACSTFTDGTLAYFKNTSIKTDFKNKVKKDAWLAYTNLKWKAEGKEITISSDWSVKANCSLLANRIYIILTPNGWDCVNADDKYPFLLRLATTDPSASTPNPAKGSTNSYNGSIANGSTNSNNETRNISFGFLLLNFGVCFLLSDFFVV